MAMISVEQIREIDFTTSMSGYKKSEVDDFLDELAEDYEKLIKQNQQLNAKIQTLNSENTAEPKKEVHEEKPASNNVQEVHGILETAQRFSDQLISEAKEKAEQIITEATLKAKELEAKIANDKEHHEEIMAELKMKAEASISEKLKDAVDKSENILAAAKQSVADEKQVYDNLRIEASNFKSKLLDSYKKQLELLNELPVEIPFKEKIEIADEESTSEEIEE